MPSIVEQLLNEVWSGGLMASGLFDPVQMPDGSLGIGIDAGHGAIFRSDILARGGRDMMHVTGGVLGRRGAGDVLFSGTMGILPAIVGFQQNGFAGAVQGMAADVATNAALLRYHYAPAAQAGNIYGGVIAPGIFNRSGASFLRAGANSATWAAKGFLGGGIGGAIGGGVGGALGRKAMGGYGEFVGNIGGTFLGSYAGTAAVSSIASAGIPGMLAAGGVGAVVATAAATVGATAVAGYGSYMTLKAGYQHRQMQRSIHTSGSLAAFHTQGAQTMRAKAVQAIHKSHLNARSALGQEANLMHFPSKNYHSKYRRFY